MKGEINAMMKVEIVMDEDKIREEEEYDVELVKYNVCRPFEEKGLCRIVTSNGSIAYCDRERDEDFTWFWYVNLSLAKTPWFVRYVKEWVWFRDGNRENVKEGFLKNKVGAFA